MAQQDGIDLARSGWENPEGFKPTPRPNIPAPPVAAICESKGPHGWVCDLPPNHVPADQHRADDGSPGGFRWTQNWADVTNLQDSEPQRIPAGVTIEPRDRLSDIESMAQRGLESPHPAQWAIALERILEVCRG